MSPCDEYSDQILRYLDGGLEGQELKDFRLHLEGCADCRAKVEAERALSHLFHRSRPLYSAPAALRERVAAAAHQHPGSAPWKGLYERILGMLEGGLQHPAGRLASLRILVPALVIVGLLLLFVPNLARQARAASYVEAAVATHRSFVSGQLPLEFKSSSAEAVSAWFTGKVSFPVRLPNAESIQYGTPAYRLVGADLVSYQRSPAALVTYEKQNEKISLLVAPSESAVVAGGDEIRSGALTFHYRTDQDFKVITWSNHGLSYALVSSVLGSARESCMVCHQSMPDHRNFKPTP